MSVARDNPGLWHHIGTRPGLLTWIVALGLLAFAVLGLLERHVWGDTSVLFWDVPVYVATMEAQARGLNPYSPEVMRGFGIPSFLTVNTPPLPTWLMGLAGSSAFGVYFGPTLIALAVLSLLAIPFCLGRIFFGKDPAAIALAFAAYLVLYACAGITSVGAANHGTILHALMIVGMVPGLSRGRWHWFYVAVALAALLKPQSLAYLIIPVAAQGWSWRQFGYGVLVSLGVGGVYLATFLVTPTSFADWLNSIRTAAFVIGDSGLNVFNAHILVGSDRLRYGAQAVIALAFLSLAILSPMAGKDRWAALLLAVQFVNPRLMPYDIAIAAIPLAYLARRCVPAGRFGDFGLPLAVGALFVFQMSGYNDRLLDRGLVLPLTSLAVLAWASARASGAARRP